MRQIKTAIVADMQTFESICNVVIVNTNKTITKLVVLKETQNKYLTKDSFQILQFINQVLKDNSLSTMTQEEIDFVKNNDLVENFIKKEFSVDDLQKVAGIK